MDAAETMIAHPPLVSPPAKKWPGGLLISGCQLGPRRIIFYHCKTGELMIIMGPLLSEFFEEFPIVGIL